MKKIAVLVMFTLFQIAKSNAATEHDFQIWGNITAIGSFNANQPIKYWLENQDRFGADASRLSQTLLRPGLGYALTPALSIWLGYAWIYSSLPLITPANEENRIWQQLLLFKNYERLRMIFRSRLEERFPKALPSTLRYRQLVKLATPILTTGRVNFVLSDEIFLRLTSPEDVDQNRFFIGFDYLITKKMNVEIGYLKQIIFRPAAGNFSANCLSLAIYLNN